MNQSFSDRSSKFFNEESVKFLLFFFFFPLSGNSSPVCIMIIPINMHNVFSHLLY